MCDCAGDASCVLRFCRAISLDAPKVADVRAAADCVEDLRGAAPDEVEAICAQWKVLAKGKFRRAVAALQAEVRQGADGAFDLDDAAPVTPAAREGEVRAAVARDGGGPEEAPAPEAPAPARRVARVAQRRPRRRDGREAVPGLRASQGHNRRARRRRRRRQVGDGRAHDALAQGGLAARHRRAIQKNGAGRAGARARGRPADVPRRRPRRRRARHVARE